MNLATQAVNIAATLDTPPLAAGRFSLKEGVPKDQDMMLGADALPTKMANRCMAPVLPGSVLDQHINVTMSIRNDHSCPAHAPAITTGAAYPDLLEHFPCTSHFAMDHLPGRLKVASKLNVP
jgi:hypothetical protein